MTDRELKEALMRYTQPGADQLETVRANVLNSLAQEAPAKPQRRKKSRRHSAGFRLVVAAAVIVLCVLFVQTPPGAAAVEIIREQVVSLIETLFPPKEITVMPEGEPEALPHAAQGKEPAPEPDAKPVPGFAIYIDPERYVMTEEDGVSYIRPIPVLPTREEIASGNSMLLEGLSPEEREAEIDRMLEERKAFYAALPACEIEIAHLPDTTAEAAADAARQAMVGSWAAVSEIVESTQPARLWFSASGGQSWDSPQEDLYFISDGQQGVFRLTARYYLEAAEGHSVRFSTMIGTFAVIDPQTTGD